MKDVVPRSKTAYIMAHTKFHFSTNAIIKSNILWVVFFLCESAVFSHMIHRLAYVPVLRTFICSVVSVAN